MHTCVTHTGGHLGTLVCLHAFFCVCFLKKRPPWHTRMPTHTTAQFSVCYTHTGVLQHTLCVTTHLGTQHRPYMLQRPPWHTRRPTRTTAQFLHAHMHAYRACPTHTQQQPHTAAANNETQHSSSHMHAHCTPCRRRSEYAHARRASWACDRQRAPLPAPKCAPRPVSPPRWLSALNSRGSRLYIIHLYNS